MGRKLKANVYVGGVLHEAGSAPPNDVAEKITNPAAWEDGNGGYADMTVADLKAEIDRRNDGRDEADRISKDGKKDDLVAALELDDE